MLLHDLLFIRKMVLGLNKRRKESGRLLLESSADMFSLGNWSLTIIIPNDGCLYSIECASLFPMLAQLGCSFFIGTRMGVAKIFIQ